MSSCQGRRQSGPIGILSHEFGHQGTYAMRQSRKGNNMIAEYRIGEGCSQYEPYGFTNVTSSTQQEELMTSCVLVEPYVELGINMRDLNLIALCGDCCEWSSLDIRAYVLRRESQIKE